MKNDHIEAKKIVNELLVDIFNRILIIEAEYMKKQNVKLSMNEIHVLEAIERVDEPSMSNIAKQLHITVGSLTTAINTLFQKKYVIRDRDVDDRRKVIVRLTDLSYDVLSKHEQFHNHMIDSIFKDLNVGEDQLLIDSLRNLSSFFSR
ncbi:MarR family winged helix-turn-helix transcriptional regulator [Mycoplasmatota bacterium]|nr:MarR family winged helix-turn-helix transcriptional regulator [Mycoplasmatota bacterium]